MGAYFRKVTDNGLVIKTLMRKRGGSVYPTVEDFNEKISLLKKYLGDFVVDTKVIYDGKSIKVQQPEIYGEDVFIFLKENRPARFSQFVQCLDKLYLETGILPDLINNRNVLVTKDGNIKIVDVWPLFFKKRVDDGDINQQSYEENIQRLNLLKSI